MGRVIGIMDSQQLEFLLERAAPQGNKTVRFRVRLADGERISHQPIPFIYVRKDYWKGMWDQAVVCYLDLKPAPGYFEPTGTAKDVPIYRLRRGKDNHTLVNLRVWDIPQRQAIQHHPYPFIYGKRKFFEELGDAEYWMVTVKPLIPKASF